MLKAKIIGTGSYLPKKILTNADLEKMVDTTDEWITTRTGIKERHIAADDETTTDMATIACDRAIKDAKITSDKIDCVLVATATPDMSFPSCACLIQDRLQTSQGMAMDFSAACTGFIYGLHIANSLIATRQVNNVLLVAADKLSAITDYTDRNTCVLFGDGAGAVVLTGTEENEGILGSYVGADGSKADVLKKISGMIKLPISKMGPYDHHKPYLYMDGKTVFKAAVHRMTTSLSAALEKAGKKLEDLQMIIPHQANMRIIDMVREYAKLSLDQVYVSLPKIGNTSSSTIPIALDEAIKLGKLKKGTLLGVTAFGGGLTFGAAVLQM
jgi:3-oxoacyl-[acyl-carrier-protein] synthase III